MASDDLSKKNYRLYPWLLFIFIIIFLLADAVYSILYPIFIGENKIFYLRPGSKISIVANELEKKGIIRSAFYFKFIVAIRNSQAKAGFYEFNGSYNLIDVVKTLEKGGKGIRIVITEGMTLKEIENLFNKNKIKINLSKYTVGDFPEIEIKNHFPASSTLEGFLAPDTYEFLPSEEEKKIIAEILSNFSKKILPEIIKGTDFSPYEYLILASIVEKEAKMPEDFPVIAGILIKRLKNKRTLDVDASLIYEKCGFVFCREPLTREDLKKKTAYNTYQNLGLPPTPISNPGLPAIKSINQPMITDYWYYLTNSEGKAIFAKTLKEHELNIKKYLRR